MFFSDITKNLNREILTENLVTFNGWDGAKNEKFTEKSDRGRGSQKTNIQGELPKKGAWQKRGRGCF